ncbi:hypothetical protein L1987_02217 [Smallanthus sonchifolius]|uniref:Uncharacterized protein n=1 Tax=Smallanthus sonchifolius TaxID=185202 RepID=A0ACB9K753_9ASTR|nr:hypothetical protein L1987_02217 [Smallanthus sonchifolius]
MIKKLMTMDWWYWFRWAHGLGFDNDYAADDDDGEKMEKLLIKHIVEKARQGSLAVMNAPRQKLNKKKVFVD